MNSFSVKLEDNTGAFLNALPEAVDVAMEMIGLQAEGYAKMKCPVDTGNLRNSISHMVANNAAYIGTGVNYAAYVEMGTSKMAARPYIEPAVTEHSDEYKDMVLSCLKNA